ncbi:citrate synthase family protein [Uliginosibacterium aquaticum]|uniref:citrate synthase (unknown stereospecificity) n=1 Tax=Uliginosibacterium aquaticum TaxID=2731212 RepID=A0ABX2ILR1_9RHOO|nr:citrate synthase family protein [Uliginosibacterium aquaticum]NSL55256.1 helix-turn-helix domain-containing protein [Uliginosibacterium aquaticum]
MTRLIDSVTAAALLGVSRQTLYSYVSRGLLRAQPAPEGRGKRYRRAEVERLVRQSAQTRKPRAAAGATLDFGLPVLASALTLIAGGQLWYRGQNAIQLAAQASLEDVACLLWQAEATLFATPVENLLAELPAALASLQPLERALAVFPALALQAPGLLANAESADQQARCVFLLRAMAAALLGRALSAAPIHQQCAQVWGLDADGAQLVRQALVLCADHELNASSFTARCVASTGAQLHAALLGGLAALSGPRHGMASERVEDWLDELAPVASAAELRQTLAQRKSLPGFGHRLYPSGDPRARSILAALPVEPMLMRLCEQIEKQFGEYPNLDFALVALRRSLGLPQHSASVLFALGRTVGWLAHALEQMTQRSLIRPRAHYVGEKIPAPTEAQPAGRIVRMGRG